MTKLKQRTIEEVQKIIDDYLALVEDARKILGSPPYRTYPDEDHLRLDYEEYDRDGKHLRNLLVTWPEVHSGYYDSCSMEKQERRFPFDEILMDGPELDAHIAEQKRLWAAKLEAERLHQLKVQAERAAINERMVYEQLRRKFESGQ